MKERILRPIAEGFIDGMWLAGALVMAIPKALAAVSAEFARRISARVEADKSQS